MSKVGLFISLAGTLGSYGYNPEYENLTDEEKDYLDYQELCLNDPDSNFTDACFKIMLLIMELASKFDTDEELTQEEAEERIRSIQQGFTEEDKERLDAYMAACIQTMGIYSEESIKERKLKKERK